MDLLPALESEQAISDDGFSESAVDFDVNLPSMTHFSSQLTSSEAKTIYDIAKSNMVTGNNVFSVGIGYSPSIAQPICEALSAVQLTYTEKTDWIAKPGGVRWQGNSSSMTITLDKSAYYSSSLDSQANEKAKLLVEKAKAYAKQNYPYDEKYGVVEYIDGWLCENNYYSNKGGVYKQLGLDVYYYCHSAYGALLKGYAVCESYAKAMSRCLDAAGITNMYVTGYANGDPAAGHAWNYVQMRDGKWYLVDSTWNNPASDTNGMTGGKSNKLWLLSRNDSRHTPTGQGYTSQTKKFRFATVENVNYVPNTTPPPQPTPIEGEISLSPSTLDLEVGGDSGQLTCTPAVESYNKAWISSNTGVATVDDKGNVTAKAPGTATITLTVASGDNVKTASSTVKVYQVKALNSERTGKSTDSVSIGSSGGLKSITLGADVGGSPYTAEQLVSGGKCTLNIESSNTNVASVSHKITGNEVTVDITPVASGKAEVSVELGGKTATISVTVSDGDVISEDMFELVLPENGYVYNGTARTPRLKKVTEENLRKGKDYTVSYLNNKNAGTASVKVTGIKKYSGEAVYTFDIATKSIENASLSVTKSKGYNGNANPPSVVVSLGGRTLKKNTDYKILYDGNDTPPVNVGTYEVSIEGMGNYEGTVSRTRSYTVKKASINSVSLYCDSKLYATGGMMNPVTAKIGKNTLPVSDYTIKYYKGKKTGKKYRIEETVVQDSGYYFAVITGEGENVSSSGEKVKIFRVR